MWPFKKKIKVNVEVVEVKPKEDVKLKTSLEVVMEQRRKSNREYIKNISKMLIERYVNTFTYNNPAPFKEGDIVTPNKAYVQTLGWAASGISFINHFKEYDERINYSVKMKVDKVFVDSSWLKDFLDPDYTRNAVIQELLTIADQSYIESQLLYEMIRAEKARGGKLVEWVIDFNWKELGFKQPDREYLDLKWGGMAANTFLHSDHVLVELQSNLEMLEKEQAAVKLKYEDMYKTWQEMYKRTSNVNS